MMEKLISILHEQNCSLVLCDSSGLVHTYYNKGVRDLDYLLDHHPEILRGATIADKVTGKAAAGMAIVGGAKYIYADILSRQALPLLDAADISYSYGSLVDHIIIPAGDRRCPLEQIVATATTAEDVVRMLKAHFREMKTKQSNKTYQT
ncbi:MAG: DUF1893 domain-containing protein [Prevotella sp.]